MNSLPNGINLAPTQSKMPLNVFMQIAVGDSIRALVSEDEIIYEMRRHYAKQGGTNMVKDFLADIQIDVELFRQS